MLAAKMIKQIYLSKFFLMIFLREILFFFVVITSKKNPQRKNAAENIPKLVLLIEKSVT